MLCLDLSTVDADWEVDLESWMLREANVQFQMIIIWKSLLERRTCELCQRKRSIICLDGMIGLIIIDMAVI